MAWDNIDTDRSRYPGPPDVTDDLDEIAIERAVAGDGMRLEHLTIAEQKEVVRRLTEQGKSIRDIADQLATTKRTVSRRRIATHAA
jgi:DNA-binding NarL/FixJ family response regulator